MGTVLRRTMDPAVQTVDGLHQCAPVAPAPLTPCRAICREPKTYLGTAVSAVRIGTARAGHERAQHSGQRECMRLDVVLYDRRYHASPPRLTVTCALGVLTDHLPVIAVLDPLPAPAVV